MSESAIADSPLGHDVAYPVAYDPTLLYPIARDVNRRTLPMLPKWAGADIWNAYEISWLNHKGKPVAGVARFVFSQASPNLIESKSLKLYLNSFNEARFEDSRTVRDLMVHDLSHAAGDTVEVMLESTQKIKTAPCRALEGICIDDADIEVHTYHRDPSLLRCVPAPTLLRETLTSDLLKSNCPVTGQPDWASLQIQYEGPQIDRAALLEYIISLRRHDGFHEHCVEQIYCDIWHACHPNFLFVYARYTRRGGLDINPWRSSAPVEVSQVRTIRQ